MKIAFFDTKPYDKPSFDRYAKENGVSIKYFETKLNEDTASLAEGYDAVCVFVNDNVNSAVIDKLQAYGVLGGLKGVKPPEALERGREIGL